MTDNEIVKALKELLEVMLYEGDLQRASTISNTIDFINRQKAKIEECTKGLAEVLKGIQETKALYVRDIARAKTEAVKEFAERLKKECVQVGSFGYVSAYNIDNLVTEMVGGNDVHKKSDEAN